MGGPNNLRRLESEVKEGKKVQIMRCKVGKIRLQEEMFSHAKGEKGNTLRKKNL